MAKHLSVSEVEERFEEAARTLRRLPDPPGSGPKGYGSSWPDYVRDARHAYGYHDTPMRVVPNAGEIARMEECIEWLSMLSPDDAKIVWLRAEGRRWRDVGIKVGVVRQTAWRRWVAALQTLAKRLSVEKKPAPGRKTQKKAKKSPEKQENLEL